MKTKQAKSESKKQKWVSDWYIGIAVFCESVYVCQLVTFFNDFFLLIVEPILWLIFRNCLSFVSQDLEAKNE